MSASELKDTAACPLDAIWHEARSLPCYCPNPAKAKALMPSFKETLTINDKPLGDRAVEVTVIAPEGKNVLNVQQLAERAWRTVDKKITVDGVTVKVRSFRR